jgi:hypothetical protein
MRELAVIGDTGGAEFRALVAGQGSLRPCASCPSSRLNSRSRSSGFGRDQNDGTGRAFVDQGVLNQDPRPERKCTRCNWRAHGSARNAERSASSPRGCGRRSVESGELLAAICR